MQRKQILTTALIWAYSRALLAYPLPFGLLTAAAQDGLWFRHIDSKGYEIRTIHCDASSVVWLGTSSGLVSMPQLMTRNPEIYHREHKGLNTAINEMSGDSLGWLCMRTQNRDVVLYNPRQDRYLFDPTSQLAKEGVHVSKEYTMMFDDCSRRWIWKGDKLFAKGWTLNFNGEQVQGLCPQPAQAVVLTSKALYYVSVTNGKIIRRVPLPEDINDYANLYGVGDVEIWVWTGRTICKYDYPSNHWMPAVTMPSDITGVQIDNDGRRWVSTQGQGIFIYDHDGHMTQHLLHDAWDTNSLQSNRINHLFFERETNTMWIAYWKGGLSLCNTHSQEGWLNRIPALTAQKANTDVLTLNRSADGKHIFAGTEDHGVFSFGKDGLWDRIADMASATALYADPLGTLWMGLYGKGLVSRTPNGQQRQYFPGWSPFAIAEDSAAEGQRWLYVAILKEGVWRLNPQTGDIANTNIGHGFVSYLQFHNHHLYAATTDGFFVMTPDGRWRKVCDGKFRSFSIDHSGYFWLLGDIGYEGLTLLNPREQPVEVPYGLSHAALKGITVDKDNQTWITSNHELLMLRHTADGQLEQYHYNINPDGQNLYYNYHAIMTDDSDRLWLGTTKGYQCFSIARLTGRSKADDKPARLLTGAISINDEVCSPGQEFNGRILLSGDIIYTKELSLKHNENNIVIECTPIGTKDFTTHTYYYQLKGLSDDWRQLKDQTIVLSNLPPGDYRLMVRTQQADETQLLRIRIAPPLWFSWWARLLYLLLAGLLVYGIVRYYNNRRAYRQKLNELELQQEQQAQMNEMKLRFFTNISHDLRTPLSLIIGPIEELMKQVRDKKQLASLQMIHRNADHLLSLVNQILDFRRLEFGREKLVLSFGDVVPLLEDICTSFKLKGEKENIKLSLLSSVEKIETSFDRDKTTKIMMNLLSNAFKFTEAGGSITVRLGVMDDQIVISVADTGIGIPDADKAHIFDRFFQSDTGNRSSIGSGIGLHIVREYVRLQGGDITISDPPEGQGSIFRFTIPLRNIENVDQSSSSENDANDEGRASTFSGDADNDTPSEHGTTLLLVDDNQDLLTYMSQALAEGHEILTASNGREAIQQLQTHDIDIIVSDVMMPEMDGLELTRHIKTDINTSHIPIVLLTAKTMNYDELQGLEAGADDYITKPFSMDILRKRIQNLIERSQNRYQRFANEVDIEPSEITVTSLDEQFIARAISIVEAHISESDFNVDQLSQEIGLHRSQVYKKIQHITGKTPVLFIRLLRLKRGKQLLEQSGLYVSEIAYKVGLSPRNFSKYFKEEFGLTPKEYINKQSQTIT